MSDPFRPRPTLAKSSAPPVYRPVPASSGAPPVYKPVAAAQLKRSTGARFGAPPPYRPAPSPRAAPPVYHPNAPAQQRKLSTPLMLKPPVVQRTIVGMEGQPIWGTEIAGRVVNESNPSISKEVHRLHDSTELFPVASYDDLVSKITSPRSSPSPGPVLGQNIRALTAVFSRLRDDPSVLNAFAQVKTLWNTGEPKWRTAGIREVLKTFTFLYANAEVLNAAFGQTEAGTEIAFLEALNCFCINFLGCGVTGNEENRKLEGMLMQLGPWLKEGLLKTEAQLTKYSTNPSGYDDYVCDNLDNNVKAYFRKLDFASRDAKAYDKSDRLSMLKDQDIQIEVLLMMVVRMSSKATYLGQIWDHIRSGGLPPTFETLRSLVEETAAFARPGVVPNEQEIRDFLRSKEKLLKEK
ncbi:MAG: hypothetical protein QOE55_2607 [Acidobacteriaceae bacterium]|nr:hypothetical protein [Acidobacteriaceae bacterium]